MRRLILGVVLALGCESAAGARGAQGERGPQGEQGLTGPQGPAGAAGATGPVGAPGAQGPAGAVGPQGAAGSQGQAGPAGPQGPAGSQGLQGLQGAEGPRGPAGVSAPIYTTRFSFRFDRGRGAETPRADYSTGHVSVTPFLIDGGIPGHQVSWSILFYTTNGIETRLECRATFQSDRSLAAGGDNPHCQSDSRSPQTVQTFADRFPLVIREISDSVLDLRSPRIAFTDGWTYTDFAIRVEVTNPTQPFVTPRADFRTTL